MYCGLVYAKRASDKDLPVRLHFMNTHETLQILYPVIAHFRGPMHISNTIFMRFYPNFIGSLYLSIKMTGSKAFRY